MSGIPNPFLPTRFEYENHHIIWLSPESRELFKPRSFYVFGTRGTGKTSLLKAHSWNERVHNEILRQQISGGVIDDALGLYIKIPLHQTSCIDRVDWAAIFPNSDREAIGESVFQLYMQICIAHLLFDALSSDELSCAVGLSSSMKCNITDDIFNEYQFLKRFCLDSLTGFERLSDAFNRCQNAFRRIFITGGSLGMANEFPFEDCLVMTNKLCTIINDRSGIFSSRSLKICIDEAETLTLNQQVYLNTLVRVSEAPVFWIVAFVEPDYETTKTSLRGLSLADTDRKILNLHGVKEHQFGRFCASVSRLRLQHYGRINKEEASKFSASSVLGSSSINSSFHDVLSETKSDKYEHIKALAYSLRTWFHGADYKAVDDSNREFENAIGDVDDVDDGGTSFPAYYQAYIVARLGIDYKRYKTAKEKSKLLDYLRRKQRAALVAFHAEAGIRVRYYGWQTVHALSDGCIRDYLEIMGLIYEAHVKGEEGRASQFCKSKVTAFDQSSAIDKAGRQKMTSITVYTREDVATAFKLVECIGRLTEEFQSTYVDGIALKTPERGIISIDFGFGGDAASNAKINRLYSLLRKCESDGYIISDRPPECGSEYGLQQSNDGVAERRYRIRLHRRFAPYFQTSYRMAYAEVPVPAEMLIAVIEDPLNVDAKMWARNVHRAVQGATSLQQSLPLWEIVSND